MASRYFVERCKNFGPQLYCRIGFKYRWQLLAKLAAWLWGFLPDVHQYRYVRVIEVKGH